MNIEEIEKAVERGYFGEYHPEIKSLLSEVKRLGEELRVSREAHADTMRQQGERILELEAEVKRWKDAYEEELLLNTALP